MAITFRHQAAGVVPPSNASTRKYGQSLVLQQLQQKYQAQQAGYDRLFDAMRQERQNAFQGLRDINQNTWAADQARRQNDFLLGRDKTEFERQQQVAEAERQRQFLDEARKQSGRFILDAIDNGEFDPATARQLQQNLVEEAEALGNPGLDATQRAEALQKIRAQRAVLLANRKPQAPPPTPQEQFDQGIVVGPDGTQYRQNSKGDFEPLPQQQQRPSSAAEAFDADPKVRDKYMEDAVGIVTEGGEKPLTRESRKKAATLARELWEDDNLPTAAPPLPGQAPSSPESPMQSILEDPLEVTPPERGAIPPSPSTSQVPADLEPIPPGRSVPRTPPSQNPWEEVAVGEMQAEANKPIEQGKMAGKAASQAAKVKQPDFSKLMTSAKDDADRAFLGKMQGVYEEAQSPEIQNAISVLVNPNSSDRAAAEALMYLKSAGVDVEQLTAPSKRPISHSDTRNWNEGRGM